MWRTGWGSGGGLACPLCCWAGGGAVPLFIDLPTTEEVHTWATTSGAWVPLTFIGAYAVATLLPIPKNVLSAAAGLAFGLTIGIGLVWLAAMIGAAASFGLAGSAYRRQRLLLRTGRDAHARRRTTSTVIAK